MATLPNPLPKLASLGLALPPGKLIGTTDEPLLWIADETATPETWAALQQEPRAIGLLPVLLDVGAGHGGPEDWELAPDEMSYPGDHDPEEILADFWDECCAEEGGEWPGLAEPEPPHTTAVPDTAHDTAADLLAPGGPLKDPRLTLVPARRSADIPTVIGWLGASNYGDDTARLSSVLRSWEDRFGIRVVALGFDHLLLSVAAPPATPAGAQAVAAEHFAFCPDNIWQGGHPTLQAYAEHEVLNRSAWHFYWE